LNVYVLAALRMPIFPAEIPMDLYEIVRDSVYLRAGAIGMVQLVATCHHIYYGKGKDARDRRWVALQVARVCVQAAANFVGSLLIFQILQAWRLNFGFVPAVASSSVPVGRSNVSISSCMCGGDGCEDLSMFGDVPLTMDTIEAATTVDTVRAFGTRGTMQGYDFGLNCTAFQ